jgi:anti-sigma factor RsiW
LDCEATRTLLHGYADGELDLVSSLQIEEHLRDCAACRQLFEQQRALRGAVKEAALYYKAPDALRQRLEASLRKEERSTLSSLRGNVWRGAGLVAAAACLLFMALRLTRPSLPSPGADRLDQEVFAGHVRSLMPGHLFDVPSTDQHTVKPWFNGKLDYSPTVKNLADQGFPLIGGRLDYLNDRTVAALVYQRRKHIINLYVWPAPSSTADTTGDLAVEEVHGYHLLHWTQAGMTNWVVSDVSPEDLRAFAQLLRR